MNYNWIDIEYKEHYNENALISGIKVIINKDLPLPVNEYIKYVIHWIKKRYYFPIRYIINFKNVPYFVDKDGTNKSYDDFYYPTQDSNEVPLSWISTNSYIKEYNKNGLSLKCKKKIFYEIISHITYYYQWLFFDDVNRSQIIVNTDSLLSGAYSGMMDTSKIKKSQFNWMREIGE